MSFSRIGSYLAIEIILCFNFWLSLKCIGCQARDSCICLILSRAASAYSELGLFRLNLLVLVNWIVFIFSINFFFSFGDNFLIYFAQFRNILEVLLGPFKELQLESADAVIGRTALAYSSYSS